MERGVPRRIYFSVRYAKRTGVARRPLKTGKNLQARVHEQLQNTGNNASLVLSFFRHPSATYISDL
jgi:hypothetical protein